jgi:hypothetical protein
MLQFKKRINNIFLLLSFLCLISCGVKNNEGKMSVSPNEFKLKIGALWYNNESEIDFVYGVNINEPSRDFITEFHFKFGGKTSCDDKQIVSSIDFNMSKELILSDSINQLLNSANVIVKRKSFKSRVDLEFKNPNPGTLLFTIEKINLKPDGNKNKIFLNLESNCNNKLKLPINLIKYNVENVEKLIDIYILNELSDSNEQALIEKKVIFSFNSTINDGKYIIDYVDQNSMLILSYNQNSKEYVIHDVEKKIIKKIKRTS